MRPVTLISHGFQSHYELGFANGLAANGVAVTLLGSDTTLASLLRPGVDLLNLRGAQTTDRTRFEKAMNMLRYHARLIWFVATHRRHVTMVIGLPHPAWLVGVLETGLLRLLVHRLTLTVHNVLPHDRHTRSQRLAHWLLYRVPHRLLCHTARTRDTLRDDFGIDPARLLVVAHGSNDAVQPCSTPRELLRERAGIAAGRVALLYFGAVLPYKGLDLLLEAAERDERLHLVVAGRCGREGFGLAMRTRLHALASRGRATHEDGFVADERIGALFGLVDAVVLPYRHIDQSGVLLLALTLGVPVIATDVGEFRSMLDDTTGVVAEAPTAEALARAIDRLIARRADFRREDIRAASRRYEWAATVQPLLEQLT